MIICGQCGERNAPGAQFCGACDAFLEWDGQATGQRPVGQPQPPPQPRQNAAGQRQLPLVAPTVAQPGEVQRPRTQTRQPPGFRPPVPGEFVCGQCGAGNTPSRRFCSRCGGSLMSATVVRKPWWRRLFSRRSTVRTATAGDRKQRRDLHKRAASARTTGRRIRRGVRNVAAMVAVTGGVGYAVIAPFREAVNDAVLGAKADIESELTTKYVPVRAAKVSSTAQAPGHPAKMAQDNKTNTYWAAPTSTKEPVLVLRFSGPVEITKAIVRSGVAKDFERAHRPRRMHLVFSTGQTDDIQLADTPDPQEVLISNGAGAKRVEVHIVEVHRSLSGRTVAISEIELFGPG